VYDRLKKWNEENNWNVGIELSEVSTNPFQDLF
ncbi:Nif3-like dinuclear metal center hexameric protein, partial [Lactobacillus crispatus]